VSIWAGLKWYHELCGVRGVFELASFRVFGRPRELSIATPGSNNPVYLRMDTSDFCAYRDVLIFQDKQYVPEASDFSPATIVDVGAHIGMASILFAHKYPSATIIAIEPEPSNFTALVRNTFPYTNIVPIQAALWKENGHVSLGKSKAHPKGAFEVVEGGAERVRAITMETLMREMGISSIDLLKMDIEGAEREVFKDCAWIKHVGVIAIELHDRLKPGCRSAVETAAVGFRSDQRGDVTFFVKSL
jgi:FkbM family methyltransferase